MTERQQAPTPGVLTIYTNHPGGNFVHEYKTIKFEAVGERPATKYLQNIYIFLLF